MKQYLGNIWNALLTIFIGMRVTFRHLFVPAVTIQYPDVKPELPERERNRLYVNMDDCIGCDQCARACPVDCITIETVKSLPTEDLGKTSNGKRKALWVTKFDIDIAKCCYCQLCVFPCPTECIYMTDVYEFSEFQRNNLVYNFITLTPQEVEEKKSNYAKLEAEKAAQKAEAAKKAAEQKAADASAKAKVDPPAGRTDPNTSEKTEGQKE
jgi:NADH-quinone oxidoreductase subunit I